MPENDTTKGRLRPDAPIFTPQQMTKMTTDKGESVRNRDRKKLETRRMYKKKRMPQQNEKTEPKKYNQKSFDRRKNIPRTTKNRADRTVSVAEQGHGNDSVEDSEYRSPLETDFPPLLPVRTRETGPVNVRSRSVYALASTWEDSSSKKIVLQTPPDKDTHRRDEKDDVFSKLGLERLTLNPRSTAKLRRKAPKLRSWDDEIDTKLKVPLQEIPTTGDVLEKDPPVTVALRDLGYPSRRRPRPSISRLRDNWWNAIELRSSRRRMLVELRGVLKSRIFDPPAEDVPCTSHDDHTKGNQGHETLPEKAEPVTVCNDEVDSSLSIPISKDTGKDSSTNYDMLQEIITHGNAGALKEYLDQRNDGPDEIYIIMDRLVRSDEPHLLRVVLMHLSYANGGASAVNSLRSNRNAVGVARVLMLAATLGSEHSASTILASWDNATSLFTITDDDGCGIFHHSCNRKGSLAVFRLLLCHFSGGTKSRYQQLSKALMLRNASGQTALHMACECGRVDFVEVFLEVCSTALMAKLLAVEDSRSQTPLLAAISASMSDVVVCLIMWRGNRNLILQKTPQSPGKHGPPCPIVWAAKKANLDMIQLLLQFSDPAGQDYQVTESLVTLLLSAATDDVKSEGCRILIEDGANPFEEVRLSHDDSVATAALVAAKYCGSSVISALVSTGVRHMEDRQIIRRRDPKLRHQPESFFSAMECKERFAKNRTLSNALVELLYRGWAEVDDCHDLSQQLSSAVSLLMLGVTLKAKDLARLQQSIRARSLRPASLFHEDPKHACFVTSYSKLVSRNAPRTTTHDGDRSFLSCHSLLMRNMDWFQHQVRKLGPSTCPWLLDEWDSTNESAMIDHEKDWTDDEVILITNDGIFFVVHESIVSPKSARLEAAIRFAGMQERLLDSTTENPTSARRRALHVDISSKYCSLMLEHVYHGSIVTGLTRRKDKIFHDLLELMIVAEDFLCFSLLQECEMRLLHHDQQICFCWSCSVAVRHHPRKEEKEEGEHNNDLHTSDCLCYAAGPSCFFNKSGSHALDILSHIQSMDEGVSSQYSIHQAAPPESWSPCHSPRKMWLRDDSRVWSEHGALAALKSAVISTIFLHFPDAVQSSSFYGSFDWDEDDDDGEEQEEEQDEGDNTTEDEKLNHRSDRLLKHRIRLLQYLLEELSMSVPPPCSLVKSFDTLC